MHTTSQRKTHDAGVINDHYIGHGVAEAEVFKHGQIDETRWAHPVAVRVWSTVTDQVEAELAFGPFDAAISFADRRTKSPDFHLRVDDRSRRNLFECLLQNHDALVHFQNAHHQSIVGVTVFA